mgnify:CR=1 FL=1
MQDPRVVCPACAGMMVIDGNAVAVLTETGEIVHDQPFDTNNHYQRKSTNTPATRKPPR